MSRKALGSPCHSPGAVPTTVQQAGQRQELALGEAVGLEAADLGLGGALLPTVWVTFLGLRFLVGSMDRIFLPPGLQEERVR